MTATEARELLDIVSDLERIERVSCLKGADPTMLNEWRIACVKRLHSTIDHRRPRAAKRKPRPILNGEYIPPVEAK